MLPNDPATLDGRAIESFIGGLVASLEEDPAALREVEARILDGATPDLVKEWLVIALGRARRPDGHRLLIRIGRALEVARSVRLMAISSIGHRRCAAPPGPMLISAGHCRFGYPIQEESLLGALLDLYVDETIRDALPGSGYLMAHVLSGSVRDPRVPRALGARLDSADTPERASCLSSLSRAPVEMIRQSETAISQVVGSSSDGSVVGHGALCLLRIDASRHWCVIEPALRRLLDVQRTRKELAKAVSYVVSGIGGGRHPTGSALMRPFLAEALATIESGQTRRVVLMALASVSDSDCATPEMEPVLSALLSPTFSARDRLGVVFAIRPRRLSRAGVARVMEALARGAALGDESVVEEMSAVFPHCPAIPEGDLLDWARRMDVREETTKFTEVARRVMSAR